MPLSYYYAFKNHFSCVTTHGKWLSDRHIADFTTNARIPQHLPPKLRAIWLSLFHHPQVTDFVNHATNRGRVLMDDGMVQASKPQRFYNPPLVFRTSDTAFDPGNL